MILLQNKDGAAAACECLGSGESRRPGARDDGIVRGHLVLC